MAVVADSAADVPQMGFVGIDLVLRLLGDLLKRTVALDALLVSVSFELDYVNLVKILISSGIEPSRQLRKSLPMLIVGGIAVTGNPEPVLSSGGGPSHRSARLPRLSPGGAFGDLLEDSGCAGNRRVQTPFRDPESSRKPCER
jgi:hypothetical protein